MYVVQMFTSWVKDGKPHNTGTIAITFSSYAEAEIEAEKLMRPYGVKDVEKSMFSDEGELKVFSWRFYNRDKEHVVKIFKR